MATTQRIDMEGRVCGRLTVIERVPWYGTGFWKCVCICGKMVVVDGKKLRNGHSKSCGCLKVDTGKAKARHGQSDNPTYNTWVRLKDRCLNPNSPDYRNYGGRGITVCEIWLECFENFYADMGSKPKGKSLDRRNNDGNYEPSNCRWATPLTQARNKRPYTPYMKMYFALIAESPIYGLSGC